MFLPSLLPSSFLTNRSSTSQPKHVSLTPLPLLILIPQENRPIPIKRLRGQQRCLLVEVLDRACSTLVDVLWQAFQVPDMPGDGGVDGVGGAGGEEDAAGDEEGVEGFGFWRVG